MENVLVLSKIPSYLPAKDLKRLRAVNSFWNFVALPIFKRKTKLKINISVQKEGNKKLSRFKREMKKWGPFESLELIMNERYGNYNPHPQAPIKNPNFKCAYYMFTKILSPQLKSLHMNIQVANRDDIKLFLDILQHFCQSLENMNLILTVHHNAQEILLGISHIREKIQFPNLKSLNTNIIPIIKSSEEARYRLRKTFFEDLCKIAPNIEELGEFREELLVVLNDNNILKKLKSLKLFCYTWVKVEDKIIKDITRTFKSLIMENIGMIGDSPQLELLLENNKFSLEHLKLGLVLKLVSNSILKFSRLSSLKSLKLSFFTGKSLNIQFLFPGTEIQYCNDFPSLKYLIIRFEGNISSWVSCPKKIYDAFFPIQRVKCNSLQFLKISKEYTLKSTDWEKENKLDLKSIFPNAKIVFVKEH